MVPSFSDKPQVYEVNLIKGTCTCKRFEIHGNCIKHIAAARAFEWACGYVSFNENHAEELMALVMRVYATIKPKETPVHSLSLFHEVAFFPYASPELKESARRRHVRVLLLKGAA